MASQIQDFTVELSPSINSEMLDSPLLPSDVLIDQ